MCEMGQIRVSIKEIKEQFSRQRRGNTSASASNKFKSGDPITAGGSAESVV